jgi:hypothetical protein
MAAAEANLTFGRVVVGLRSKLIESQVMIDVSKASDIRSDDAAVAAASGASVAFRLVGSSEA